MYAPHLLSLLLCYVQYMYMCGACALRKKNEVIYFAKNFSTQVPRKISGSCQKSSKPDLFLLFFFIDIFFIFFRLRKIGLSFCLLFMWRIVKLKTFLYTHCVSCATLSFSRLSADVQLNGVNSKPMRSSFFSFFLSHTLSVR